jgi:predicted Zn finger-like uncharacterized protein
MTTHTVTRCPQCGTSFRITPAQLQSARGAVRCGSCLHIFRAQDHLVGGDKPAAVGSKAAPAKTTAATPGKPATAPERKQHGAPPKYSPTGQKPEEDMKAGLDTAPGKSISGKAAPGKPAQPGFVFDQSQIDAESERPGSDDDFLISDDMDQPKSSQSTYGEGLSKEFLELDKQQGSKVSLFDREIREPRQEIDDNSDESWAMSLLDDEDEGDREDDKKVSDTANIQRAAEVEELQRIFSLIEDQEEQSLAEPEVEPDDSRIQTQAFEGDLDKDPYSGEPLHTEEFERSALLMRIDPEPVEFSWVQTRDRRRWLWTGLSLLALVLLVAQVAWLQFDRLSRLQPYRAAYESICPLLGCQLPDLIDRRQISAAHLIVRNHPRMDNALEVNLMLLNNAPFEQPFPDLVLEFSDLQDKVLAVRRFTPGEYLGGELSGRHLMPRNQPIRLTLELVHPGPTAVNYRAYIPN